MAIRIHHREQRVVMATTQIEKKVLKVLADADLTDGETVRALSAAFHNVLAGYAKEMIRIERHGDADKPGGIE